jgi:hypothetical protein
VPAARIGIRRRYDVSLARRSDGGGQFAEALCDTTPVRGVGAVRHTRRRERKDVTAVPSAEEFDGYVRIGDKTNTPVYTRSCRRRVYLKSVIALRTNRGHALGHTIEKHDGVPRPPVPGTHRTTVLHREHTTVLSLALDIFVQLAGSKSVVRANISLHVGGHCIAPDVRSGHL